MPNVTPRILCEQRTITCNVARHIENNNMAACAFRQARAQPKINKNMCLYPRLIRNKRYLMYNINSNDRETITDERKKFVAVGCGHCIECRKQKAREWQIRLNEELKVWKYSYFITLTFSNQSLEKLLHDNKTQSNNVNEIARLAVRRFLERWRKAHKKSIHHWLITELGHNNTERIHLHGLLFHNDIITNEELEKLWGYGMIYMGEYCTEKTINYVVKYVTKIDNDHKGYESDIFCSAGLGKAFCDNPYNKEKYKYKGKDTIQYYTMKNGTKLSLPKYYRNKFFTQKQRDELWTYLLDSDKTYIRGIELRNISTYEGYRKYINVLAAQQKENTQMGYGSTNEEWDEKIYKITFDMLHNSGK